MNTSISAVLLLGFLALDCTASWGQFETPATLTQKSLVILRQVADDRPSAPIYASEYIYAESREECKMHNLKNSESRDSASENNSNDEVTQYPYICVPKPKGDAFYIDAKRRMVKAIYGGKRRRKFIAMPTDVYDGIKPYLGYVQLVNDVEELMFALQESNYGSKSPSAHIRLDSARKRVSRIFGDSTKMTRVLSNSRLITKAFGNATEVIRIDSASGRLRGVFKDTTVSMRIDTVRMKISQFFTDTSENVAPFNVDLALVNNFTALKDLRPRLIDSARVRWRRVHLDYIRQDNTPNVARGYNAEALYRALHDDHGEHFQPIATSGLAAGNGGASLQTDLVRTSMGGLQSALGLQLSSPLDNTSADSSAGGRTDTAVTANLATQQLLGNAGNLAMSFEYPLIFARTPFSTASVLVRAISRLGLTVNDINGLTSNDLNGGIGTLGASVAVAVTGKGSQTVTLFAEGRAEGVLADRDYLVSTGFSPEEDKDNLTGLFQVRTGIKIADALAIDVTLIARGFDTKLIGDGFLFSARFLGFK